MKKRLSSEKGITIITVTLMIVVMIVILSVVTFYATNSIGVEQFQNMKADIEEIESKSYYYYLENGVLPVNYNVELAEGDFSGQKNQNDSGKYYLVNKELLGVYSTAYQTDYYINERTLTVYAKNPVTVKGKVYSRSNEPFDKVVDDRNVPEWERDISALNYPYPLEVFVTEWNAEHTGKIITAVGGVPGNKLIVPYCNLEGDPIVGIKEGAFRNLSNIDAVYIMSNIKDIPEGAFNNTVHIANLYLNNNGTVGKNNFNDWNVTGKIWIGENVIIPDGTESTTGVFSRTNTTEVYCLSPNIGKYAFANYGPLTTVVLPDSLKEIKEGCFYLKDHLEKVYRVSDVLAYGADYFPSSYKDLGVDKNVHLPDSLTELGISAFNTCRPLTGTLDLYTDCPSLTKIGDYAFKDTNITKAIIKTGTTYNRLNSFPTSNVQSKR